MDSRDIVQCSASIGIDVLDESVSSAVCTDPLRNWEKCREASGTEARPHLESCLYQVQQEGPCYFLDALFGLSVNDDDSFFMEESKTFTFVLVTIGPNLESTEALQKIMKPNKTKNNKNRVLRAMQNLFSLFVKFYILAIITDKEGLCLGLGWRYNDNMGLRGSQMLLK